MTEGLHRLASALVGPLVDPGSRMFWGYLVGALVIATGASVVRGQGLFGEARVALGGSILRHRSTGLDVQLLLLRALTGALVVLPHGVATMGLALAVARGLSGAIGRPPAGTLSGGVWALLYSFVLFVLWDLSRYLLHRALHAVPALWAVHQVHHSAQVLTPLTFYRVHPVETLLYELRGILVTGVVAGAFLYGSGGAASQLQLLGAGALGVLFNLLGGNLRHSHVWLSYGPRIERWLISPAQHQLHHEIGGDRRNYGAWLAVWDGVAGTLRLAGVRRELRFGLARSNHDPGDLLSALAGPLWGGRRPMAMAAGLLLLLATPVRAEEGGAEDAEEGEGDAEGEGAPGGEPEAEPKAENPDGVGTDSPRSLSEVLTIVDSRAGVPRVAGSAQVVDAETLERREYDDIHRVLAAVPGVYVRDEDGYGLRPNIGLRGASSDRSAKVTLMEDGVLLAPAPYSAPAAYYFPATTRMVAVEVWKGSAATRHGPHTVGGALNMVTRAPPLGLGGALDVAIGTRRTLKLHGHGGYGGPRFGFLVEGVHLASDGFKVLDGGGPTGFAKSEVMVKVRVGSPPEAPIVAGVELKGGYANERSFEEYLGLSDDDFAATPDRRYAASQEGLMSWHRGQAEGTFTLRAGGAFDLRVTGSWHGLDRSWRKLNRFANGPDLHDLLLDPSGGQAAVFAAVLRGDEDSSTPETTLIVGTNRRRFHAGGVQAVAHLRGVAGPLSHATELGLRLHSDQIQRHHTESPFLMRSGRLIPAGGDDALVTENLGRAIAVAAHVHEELHVGPLRLLPALRVEVIRTEFTDEKAAADSVIDTQIVPLPGLGIVLQPRHWLSLLGGVHRGFSPVSPGQAPGSEAESSWNWELGARLAERGTKGELIGFFNDYVNLTGQCTMSGGCEGAQLDAQFNAGKAFVWGVEAMLHQEIELPKGFGLGFGASYTYTGSHFRTGFLSEFPQFGRVERGDALPYVPPHQGAANVVLRHPFGSVELAASAQSAMRDIAGQGPIVDQERLPAHLVLDLFTDVQLHEHIALYGTINNLTNARYLVSRRPFGARPGAPFSAMFGVKIRG